MKSDDPRADNLLLRLFSYTPRLGRLPLEDFCTEALAWCLRNCVPFRKAFFKSFGLDVKEDRVAVATQNSYEYEGDVNGTITDAGRFDLLVQIGDDEILAVIEIKVGSPFSPKQLSGYQEELKRQQERLRFKRGILLTLTDKTEKPKGSQAHQTWASVQQLLGTEQTDRIAFDHVTRTCAQFAEFLKEKGLGPMNIPATASAPLNHWVEGLRFRQRLEEILKGVTNDSDLYAIFGRKRIAFEETADGKVWIGIYGIEQHFWIGFGFRQTAGRVEIFMLVQKAVSGDRRKQFPEMKPEYAEGKTWLNLERLLDGNLDGNGEKTKEWLVDSAKALSQIQ